MLWTNATERREPEGGRPGVKERIVDHCRSIPSYTANSPMLAIAALKINSLKGERRARRMQSYPSSLTATNRSVRYVASPQVRILVDQSRCIAYKGYKTTQSHDTSAQ